MKYVIAARPEPFEPTKYYGKDGFGPRNETIEYVDRFRAYEKKLALELEEGRNQKIIITKTRR